MTLAEIWLHFHLHKRAEFRFQGKKDKAATEGGVEVALNPEELDLQDPTGLQKKYEEGLKQQRRASEEDFSDMVAEHSARQNVRSKFC